MEVLTIRMKDKDKEYRFYSDKSLWIIHINRIDVVDKGCESCTLHIPFSSIEYFTTEAFTPEGSADD